MLTDKNIEFLKNVAMAMATQGHRGNAAFIEAFRLANAFTQKYETASLDERQSPATITTATAHANLVRSNIKVGLEMFVAGRQYYDDVTRLIFRNLVA